MWSGESARAEHWSYPLTLLSLICYTIPHYAGSQICASPAYLSSTGLALPSSSTSGLAPPSLPTALQFTSVLSLPTCRPPPLAWRPCPCLTHTFAGKHSPCSPVSRHRLGLALLVHHCILLNVHQCILIPPLLTCWPPQAWPCRLRLSMAQHSPHPPWGSPCSPVITARHARMHSHTSPAHLSVSTGLALPSLSTSGRVLALLRRSLMLGSFSAVASEMAGMSLTSTWRHAWHLRSPAYQFTTAIANQLRQVAESSWNK